MILNYGSLNIDLVFRVPHFVRPGETLAAQGVSMFAGGKGANQSIACARAGGKVAHAGKIGRDGNWMKDALAREGVDTSAIQVDDHALSGQAVIQVNEQGENCILLSPGTNGTITPEEIDGVLGRFSRQDVILFQNEVSQTLHLIQAAKARGMMVVFNAAPCTPEVKSYPLSSVDLLVVNETEGAELTGKNSPADILAAAGALWPNTALLLTLGGDGAWFSHRGNSIHQPVFPTQVVDTTAAGDTFLGYFLATWSQGRPPADCLRRAAVASALTVSRAGAADSIPTLREVEEMERDLQ